MSKEQFLQAIESLVRDFSAGKLKDDPEELISALKTAYIRSLEKEELGTPQYILDENPNIRRAEENWERTHTLLHAAGPAPAGCYCPADRCMAPVVMGRQTPCRRELAPAAPASKQEVSASISKPVGAEPGPTQDERDWLNYEIRKAREYEARMNSVVGVRREVSAGLWEMLPVKEIHHTQNGVVVDVALSLPEAGAASKQERMDEPAKEDL